MISPGIYATADGKGVIVVKGLIKKGMAKGYHDVMIIIPWYEYRGVLFSEDEIKRYYPLKVTRCEVEG